jgi:predicted dehydrogenase
MSEPPSLARKVGDPAAASVDARGRAGSGRQPEAQPRIGLVGCGRWGAFILRDLAALGCAVTVVARDNGTRNRALAGGGVAVGELAELPANLAGYVVATPTATHAELVERLLARERPIFVEKPLTADPASARRIAERGAGRVFVMEKWRYHPGVEALAALARSGELGPPRKIALARLQWGHGHADVDPIWTLLPHDLSIVQEILGRIPPPLAAVAELDAAGAAAGLLCVLRDAVDVQCDVSARRPRYRRSIELICRDGAAWLADGDADHIAIVRNDAERGIGEPAAERRPIAAEPPLMRELAAFVRFCGGGPAPKSTAAEGAAVVETIAALRRLAGLPY